jgi:hypothetical protein
MAREIMQRAYKVFFGEIALVSVCSYLLVNDTALLSPKKSYPSFFPKSQEIVPPSDWWVEDLPTLIQLSVQGRLYVAPPTDHNRCRTLGDLGTSQRGRN